MGTGEFAVPPLAALAASRHEVAAVISQPDRPRGRGLITEPTPVKILSVKEELNLWQPETLNDDNDRQTMKAWRPEIVVVAAYGRILPSWIWEDPPLGAINIHGSILPAYRGAAPIQRAVMNGDEKTGVTIVKIAPEVDTGDVLLTAETQIEADETSGELFGRLSVVGAELILEALDLIENGRAIWTPQPVEGTNAPKISKKETRINWSADAIVIKNHVRGLNPNPGSFFIFKGKRVKLWKTAASPSDSGAKPGSVIDIMPAGPLIACGTGSIILTELQPEGKDVMTGAEFARGYRPRHGDMLE